MLLSDVLIHDDLSELPKPEVLLCSCIDGDPKHLVSRLERNRLPLTETVEELGRGVSRMITPHMPNYTDVLAYIFRHLGWDENKFRGYRFTMAYPPSPAIAILRSELPKRPR